MMAPPSSCKVKMLPMNKLTNNKLTNHQVIIHSAQYLPCFLIPSMLQMGAFNLCMPHTTSQLEHTHSVCV